MCVRVVVKVLDCWVWMMVRMVKDLLSASTETASERFKLSRIGGKM